MIRAMTKISLDHSAASIRKKRVLIAEDDDEMRSLLARAFTRDGHDVAQAEDGAALVELVVRSLRAGDPVDLVITDVRMPEVNGFEAVGWLRALGCRAPVIAITAFADRFTHMEGVRCGVVRVLDKPFDVDDLRTMARDLFAARPPHRSRRGRTS
jgi:DNA-binding response OmpR family regulator